MQFVIAFSRWVLPVLAAVILCKCLLALLLGHPKETTYGYLIDQTDGERHALNMWETSIGRSNTCDIVIGYGTVSRFQAVISRRIDGWYVFDLLSKSGILVNGEPIDKKARIRAGDSLTFGGVPFRFAVTDDPVIRVGKTKKGKQQPLPRAPQSAARPLQTGDDAPLFSYDSFYNEANKPDLHFEKPVVSDRIETPARGRASAAPRVISRPSLLNPDTGETFVLTGTNISIGRSRACDIVLTPPTVSRRHAALVLYEDGWVIEDANSTHGTYLNGNRITAPQLLFGGDTIRLGDAVLRFQAGRSGR